MQQQQLIPKQQTIPYKEFEPHQLANRSVARENAARDSEEVLKIPLDKVVFRTSNGKSFNPRQDYGNLQELAVSLRSTGQLEPGRVDALADGRFAVVEGHRRVCALIIIKDEDRKEDLFFRAALNKVGTTEKERLLQAFITQTGKPLEQYELATLFTRLINDEGMSQVELANITGKSPAYISQLVAFEQEPEGIKESVRMGNLSVNNALKLKAKIKEPAEREAAVKSAEEKAWDKGEKNREAYAENLEYDEDLVARPKRETASAEDAENVVKKTDNTVKGKRLKLDDIIENNTVIVPTLSSIRKAIEEMDYPPTDTDTFFNGFKVCKETILELFKTKKTHEAN